MLMLWVVINLLALDLLMLFFKLSKRHQGFDRLHNFIKEKLATATHSEEIQLLALAPDSWSRWYRAF